MFSFMKNKNLNPKIELEINEFKNALLVSNKIPKDQIYSLIKNLRKTYSGHTNLTFRHLKTAFSKDKSFPKSEDEQKKLCSLLEMELRISCFRTIEIINRERQFSIGITKVQVSFFYTTPYCETMEKYREKYDGKIVRIENFPIFPLYSCFHCKGCVGRVTTKSIIPELDE